MGSGRDERRAQSEVIGTVIMISMTIIGAVLIVALAGSALQAINDETQDSLARDSFHEMDNRRFAGSFRDDVAFSRGVRFGSIGQRVRGVG